MNSQVSRPFPGPWACALVCLTIGFSGIAGGQQSMVAPGMAHMAGHMHMTELRSPKAGDQQKADAVVAAAKTAMAPYQDYHKALADGYEIFLPNLPQPQYHFTKALYGLEARSHFDPLKPTSLLYKKTDRRRVQTDRSDVYGSVRRHRGRVKRPNSAEFCTLAPAHEFLQGTDGAEGSLLWT